MMGHTPGQTRSESILTCPDVIWNAVELNRTELPELDSSGPHRIDAATWETPSAALQFLAAQRADVQSALLNHGAIVLRNFKVTDVASFEALYRSLGLCPCSGPAPVTQARSGVAPPQGMLNPVNAQKGARKHADVGLHVETTGRKGPSIGAFVCFQAAESGGEFHIADSSNILHEIDTSVLSRLNQLGIRYSHLNLDCDFLEHVPWLIREALKELLREAVRAFVKVQFAAWKIETSFDVVVGADAAHPWRLQVIEAPMPALNLHPETGELCWFNAIHLMSRYLRDLRQTPAPEILNKDVYFGDLTPISLADLEHINKACEQNIVKVPMMKGDVVLLDNYRFLHGRASFQGRREHKVAWFNGWAGDQSNAVSKAVFETAE